MPDPGSLPASPATDTPDCHTARVRRYLIACGMATMLFTIGVIAWFFFFSNTATPIDPAGLTVPDGGGEPGDPGVYRYTTEGFEEIDALAGARHDYPAESFLTITAGECGPRVRWDVLAERWVEWHHCGPGAAITHTLTFHKWFGVDDLEDEECDPALPLAPTAATTVSCAAGDTIETYRIEPRGAESLTVGGVAVTVDRFEVTSELTGGTTGWSRVELWVLPGTVLVVRAEAERQTVSASPIGDVAYTEVYRLELASLQPEG